MAFGEGLQYSHTFKKSISCLHLPIFRSQSHCFFPIEKPKLPNLTLPFNRLRSLQGHHLNKLWWAGVPNATYQVLWKSAHPFQSRRFLKAFYNIWVWRPSWSCDQHHVIKFSFIVPGSFHTKFDSEWHSSFWENPVWIFVCTRPWVNVKKWPRPSILTQLDVCFYISWDTPAHLQLLPFICTKIMRSNITRVSL